MLKNVSGEVTIKWEDKSVTKPLSNAIVQLGLVALAAVLFTSVVGFVFLGLSLVGVIALIVLSAGGLGASAFFGRDFLTSLIFKGQEKEVEVVAESSATAEDSAQQDITAAQGEAKADA